MIGRSLGSGVATYIASRNKISQLVLITPFDSIKNIAQNTLPFIPMVWLLKHQYDSISRVKDINAETLILVAELDQVIPYLHTQRLFNAFPNNQVRERIIKATDHNSISSKDIYYQAMHNFLYASE